MRPLRVAFGHAPRWARLAGTILVLSACSSAPGPTGGTGVTGGSTTSTSGGTTSGVGYGPGDYMLPEPLIGLSEMASYRASLQVSFEGTVNGEPQQWVSTTAMARTADPAAVQVTVENTGVLPGADPALVVESRGSEYRRDASGACLVSAASPDWSLVDGMEPARQLGGVMGAEGLGEKTIRGIGVVGYGFDERAIGWAGLATTHGEVWVASDGGYVVEYMMTTEGGDGFFGDGSQGTMTWDYELTDVNAPVVIAVPDDCPPGLIGAPVMADASSVVDEPGFLGYDTSSNPAEVVAFYQAAAPGLGWSAGDDAAVAEIGAWVDFTVGDGTVSLFVMSGDGSNRVMLVVGSAGTGEQSGGIGAAQGGVTFEMHGGHEATGTWAFAKEYSLFSGTWTLTFTDPEKPLPDGPFLTLSLLAGQEQVSFSDGTVTIIAGVADCSFAIDHQDAAGAAGTVTCTGVDAIGASGAVDITIAFDVTS